MNLRKIELGGKTIPYELSKSRRRTIGITVRRDMTVSVRAPWGMDDRLVGDAVMKRAGWILDKLEEMSGRPSSGGYTPQERERYMRLAREKVLERVSHFAGMMGEPCLGTVRLKEMRSQWGSCSAKRNLNFNWKLILAPPEVLDYVVVHELCHLREMNHSHAFWSLVRDYCPEYGAARRWLREEGRWL